MDKKTINIIISVVLGIAAFVIVSTAISMLFDAIFIEDIINISNTTKHMDDIVMYIKHSSIAVFCISVPTIVCYFLTYFAKSKKVFGLISVVLSLFMIALCLGLIFDLRETALDTNNSSAYTTAAAQFSELGKLIVVYAITCAYFAVVTVREFMSNRRGVTVEAQAQSEQSAPVSTVSEPQKGE